MAACALVALAACPGSQATPQPAVSAPVAPATSAVPTVADVVGTWKWSLVSEDGAVRRVEHERWQLRDAPQTSGQSRQPGFVGTCERTVTFLSLDGVPFSCSQSLVYRLRATYQVEGYVNGGGLEILETAVTAMSSPCEQGARPMTRYQGALLDAMTMRLAWSDGDQTLARIRAPEPSVASQAPVPVSPLTGAWRWSSRNLVAGEVRIEVENWQLTEAPDTGRVTGTLLRKVTVFREQGSRYACSGDTFYEYQDRYQLRGQRSGDTLSITEVAVQPEQNPCLDYHERHLDAARGSLAGDHVVLIWRGGKRQVLQRK